MSRLLAGCLMLAALGAACGDPYAQIENDKQRFPPLSAARPLGSPCFQGDSASVRRARHPLGPTGGWRTTAEIDYARILGQPVRAGGYSSTEAFSVLMAHGSVIAGYVRFATDGVLQVRTYDEIYGAAYGGWSPARLEVRPTAQPVFVALGRSAYGDGGLSQVHEVCWTPRGSSAGIVVYSSAFAPKAPPLRIRQVFRAEDLGVRGQTYDDRLAQQMLTELLQDQDLTAAAELIRQAELLLGSLPPAVDGRTRAPIASRVFRAREWADLLAFKLGASTGEPAFAATARELEAAVVSQDAQRFCYGCERYERLLPLYRWVDARARGAALAPPEAAAVQRGAWGYDPVAIIGLLRGGNPPRDHAPPMRFWAGVKAYADGDADRARREWRAWLEAPPAAPSAGFELGAAARLLATLR